jgi:hypothetical protein
LKAQNAALRTDIEAALDDETGLEGRTMQSVGHNPRARQKPRRIARVRKIDRTQGEPQKPPEPARQQTGTEFTARAAGDWPPNTWWP